MNEKIKQHLIKYNQSKGYRKAGELTVISDGRVADLSKIEKKHKLTFGEVMRDIEKTFGVAGNGLKYSQFILDTLDAEREQAYKAQCDHDTFQAVQQAKQDERDKVKTELSKEALPDSAEYETGEGFKCHKVFFFTRTKWDNFWKALQDNTK